jgi:RNA polymerase sigma-70 factor (ECF subfamily)
MIRETARSIMLRLLETDYLPLKRRLTSRLRSEEMASEVLHETYLRVTRMEEAGAIERPSAYLFRTALNVAADIRRSAARRLTQHEIDTITRLDDTFDPERLAQGRQEIAALAAALEELPARCREIFVAARADEITTQVLAKRFGISTRMVEKELRRAFDHCFHRLGKKK